ncbi:hypothetical protein GA0070616_1966 [Micromonospora nigra]|uniref:Uncharacterized protein n=1 Tax=Micromonospora nigra TaxID=145857 RepID=A0A1C6RTD8_9ACTN|nr:hypothetical protein [Micromonospora nigra]SCL20390.1 hypothetical protein GA0070616_1966 [Micromonospora nigra]
MTRLLTAVLAVASIALPRPHRARWREEALAVLLAVRGLRRWRYGLDTVLKVPLLAWQHRHPGAARWAAVMAGVGLLGTPVVLLGALTLAPLIGEDTAEFLFLVAPCGMLLAVVARTWKWAALRGGGPVRHGVAVLLTAFAGTGPVASGALSVVLDVPLVALLGSVVPGGWLIATNGAALRRRQGPMLLAALGVTAGAALVGVLLAAQLPAVAPGARWFAAATGVLSLVVLVPSYLTWTTWAGTRLLVGHDHAPVLTSAPGAP